MTYLYGSDGRPGQIIDYIANIRISPIYDLSGRLVTVKEYNSTVLHGNSLRSQADYTYADKTNYLTGVKYKSLLGTLNMSYVYGDMSLNQRPDAVYTVKMNNTEYLRYSYDALGRLSERTITPINKTQSYTYVQGGYGAKSTTTLVGSVTADGTVTSYQYDAAGNITAILKNGTVYESYEYDSLNQLTKVTCQNGDVYTYTYTGNGNLSEVKKSGTVIKSYGYTDSVWKDLLTAFNGQTITYDGIGNPLTYYDGRTFSWQNGRQLAGITDGETSISYTYNGDGIRTSKTVGGVPTTYILVDGRLLGEQSAGDSIVYLYDEAGEKYGFTYRKAWYYYQKNLQGDITGIYNADGELVTEYTYDAWGAPLTVTGSLAETIGQVNPIRYRGYYYDSESGLYYLQSRYYDPEVGRFLNADGILGANNDMLSYNLFAYCSNNPVNRIDPSGHFWKEIGDFFKGVGNAIGDFVGSFFEDYKIITNENPSDVPYRGEPGSHVTSPDGTKERVYGPDGLPDRDRHYTDHGNPKYHPVPHDHDWETKENGKWEPGTPYPSPEGPLQPRGKFTTPKFEFKLPEFSMPKFNPYTGNDSLFDRIYEFTEGFMNDYIIVWSE